MPKPRMITRSSIISNEEQMLFVELASNWGAKLTIIEDGVRILRMEPSPNLESGFIA